MNYIKRLRIDLGSARARLDAAREAIDGIRSYLESAKFAVDTTVQVSDILLRLAEIGDRQEEAQVAFELVAYEAARIASSRQKAEIYWDQDARIYKAVTADLLPVGESSQREALRAHLHRKGFDVSYV